MSSIALALLFTLPILAQEHGAKRISPAIAARNADQKAILTPLAGYRTMKLDRNGDLVFRTPAGEFRYPQAIAHREIDDERKPGRVGFALQGKGVTLEVGNKPVE